MAELSIPLWAEKIIGIHTAVTNSVTHATRLKSDRYFVWQEESREDYITDNKHTEKTWHGITDLFTKVEFDPWFEAFENSIDGTSGVAWSFESTDYEEDTGLWHHQWSWEICY